MSTPLLHHDTPEAFLLSKFLRGLRRYATRAAYLFLTARLSII